MESFPELSEFLRGVERRAFKRTAYMVGDDDAALDIVQDAMIKLAEKYSQQPPNEWPMLFQRILSNTTLDWFRRRKVRNAWSINFSDLEHFENDDASDESDRIGHYTAHHTHHDGFTSLNQSQTAQILDEEIKKLTSRQREAFILRYWDECDWAQIAEIMDCSQASAKTHCHRAIQTLAKSLRSKGIES